MRVLWAGLDRAKYRYVAFSVLVSALSFARNLIFMRSLDLISLGQLALMQTLVMLVGFAQLGLVNGAYIQYSLREREMNRRIVNAMTTWILLLVPLLFGVAVVAQSAGTVASLLWPETLTIGVAAGIATIASTWLNNALVADGHLGRSNAINILAVFLSLFVASLSYGGGLYVALLSILIQPLTVAVAITVADRNLRPSKVHIDGVAVQLLIRLGFVPFLGGLFVLAMHQIERWAIAALLGTEALGQFYLVLMYSTFFALVPAALLNVFFPQAKRAYAGQNLVLLRDLVRRHLRDLFIYFVIALLATVFVLPFAVARFLPSFDQSSALVYCALPGLILFTLRDSAALVLFSSGQTEPLVFAGVMTVAVFGVGLGLIWGAGLFSLPSVLVARAVSTLPGTVLLVFAQQRQLRQMGCAS